MSEEKTEEKGAARKGKVVTKSQDIESRDWINISMRPAMVAEYAAYERRATAAKRVSQPGGARLDHRFNEKVVGPFQVVTMPSDVSLLSKTRSRYGELVRPSGGRQNEGMHFSAIDSNIGFLPAAEEGEELVTVYLLITGEEPQSKWMSCLAETVHRHPDEHGRKPALVIPPRAPADARWLSFQVNRKFQPFAGSAFKHSEEQAVAFLASCRKSRAIEAYLRKIETRPRVTKVGDIILRGRRYLENLLVRGTVERQRDVLDSY